MKSYANEKKPDVKTLSRLTLANNTYSEIKNRNADPFEDDSHSIYCTIGKWERGNENISINKEDVPKEANRAEFFRRKFKTENQIHPGLLAFIEGHASIDGMFEVIKKNTLQYVIDNNNPSSYPTIKYSDNCSHEFIINGYNNVILIEHNYIDSYALSDGLMNQILPDNRQRPYISISATATKFWFDENQNEIRHEIISDNTVFTDVRAKKLFAGCYKYLWYGRFIYSFCGDLGAVVKQRYEQPLEEIKAELERDIELDIKMDLWKDNIAIWVQDHPWLTALIVFVAVTIIVTAIVAAIIFSHGAAAFSFQCLQLNWLALVP